MTALTLPNTLAHTLRESHWRILVTGASGWLGQAALELLQQTLGTAFEQRVVAFGSQANTLVLRDGSAVHVRPLSELPLLPKQPSLLLHFAYLTREKTAQMPVAAYIDSNRAITRMALEGGTRIGVARSFVTSSGAVHAALAAPEDPNPALLYGRLKLEDEALFQTFAASAADRRVLIARLFNLSGPYINKLDAYALASFIRQARAGHIEIRAPHPVIRSYTSASNLLTLALQQLLAAEATPFLCLETAGDQTTEMAELADAVRRVVNPAATMSRANIANTPIDRYVGDGTQYRQLLQDFNIPEHSLAQQITDTADYLATLEAATP